MVFVHSSNLLSIEWNSIRLGTRWSCLFNSDQNCTQNCSGGGRDPRGGWVGMLVQGVLGVNRWVGIGVNGWWPGVGGYRSD